MQQALPYRTTWFPNSSIPTETRTPNTRFPSSTININVGDSATTMGVGTSSKRDDEGFLNKREGLSYDIKSMVSENAVIVFGRRGCCMCHVVKRLLLGLGVNPTVYEVENEENEVEIIHELAGMDTINDIHGRLSPLSSSEQFPSVFIGGRLFGGLDRLMAAHITGELIPILKEAGALWL